MGDDDVEDDMEDDALRAILFSPYSVLYPARPFSSFLMF
jgi:hypothetical protein